MRAPTPVGTHAPGSMGFTTLAISSAQSALGTHWHIRNSAASRRRELCPGASGQSFPTSPRTSLALQVPHVPVPHS